MKTDLRIVLKTATDLLICGLLLCGVVGCGSGKESSADHHAEHAGHGHTHTPPHGGTAVVLGEELAHVELVLDPARGTLTAFVMDGHLENFVKIPAASLDIRIANVPSATTLSLKPVANNATGETIGNTSQFEGQADWLKTTTSFDGVLEEISVRGTTFKAIAFNFPKGNESKP